MKDPGFIFYPGDYLRDTQCLSEKVQVAYDRIMCEHMRNICISQQKLNFFTRKLNPDEIEELMSVLSKVDGGYQIEWVAESISKRKAYSESRRENRKSKSKEDEDMKDISETYDKHMENENENEINKENGGMGERGKKIPVQENNSSQEISYEEIIKTFNNTCLSLSKVLSLTDSRKSKIKTRFSEIGSIQKFRELFNKTQNTPFLIGENEKKWKASFDWLMENDCNWIRVLEGQYDQTEGKISGKYENVKQAIKNSTGSARSDF